MLNFDYIEQFLALLSAQKSFSTNTLAAYRNDLSQFKDFLRAEHSNIANWSQVNRDTIVSFVLHLKERGYAATTVARKQAAVKSFFKFLAFKGAVLSNPVGDLASPHVDRALPHTISSSEADRLIGELNAARDTPEVLRDRAMFNLLYTTGLRVGEMVALNMGDLDLGAGVLNIRGRGKSRKVPIASQGAVAMLRGYLERARPVLAHVAGEDAEGEGDPARSSQQDDDERDALFLNHRGQRLTRQGFWLILKRYARLAGLGEVSPHTLRHSFAAQKLKNGADMRDLQEMLGHASISTTQVYARIGGERVAGGPGARRAKR